MEIDIDASNLSLYRPFWVIPRQVSKTWHPTPPKLAEIFSTCLSPKNITLKQVSAPQMALKISERKFKLQLRFNFKNMQTTITDVKFTQYKIEKTNLIRKN